MKALILAAGYATRLYPLTENKPKPLIKVGDKSIVEHILVKIEEIDIIDEVFLVTNNKFYQHFLDWSNNSQSNKNIKIINDGTLSNEDRLGAVGDINFVLKQEDINDDLLVIAGDNLFGFSLTNFINFHVEKETSIVAFHDLKDLMKVKGKFGVGILEGSRVIDFEEKPLVPRSSLASTACYLFSKNDLCLVDNLINEGRADNPGDLIKYLTKKSVIHGFVFDEHWFDVGSFESLEKARINYENMKYPIKINSFEV
jgi:glucose-1-phosphate thymidylyltransferase